MVKRDIKTISIVLPDGATYEAKAPIGYLSAMMENGLLSSDEAESGKAALPDTCVFVAETEFSESDIAKKYVYLEVSGVLAKGELFLNGKSCGILSGPHRVYLFDVADKVRAGKNAVEIRCNEVVLPKQHLASCGDRCNEYDTALRVADFAVLNPVSFYLTDSAFIEGVRVRQEHSNGRVSVFVRAETIGESDDVRVVASLSAPSGKIYFGGTNGNEIKITVHDPELWWPRGYGAQPLYKLTVTLYHGAEVADVYEKRIGLRTVELLKNDNSASSLSINGTKIFTRGATYVKQNAVYTNVKAADIEALIKSAARANMNTLTVFDETIPLPDSFYQLADKYGILIWQSITLPYVAPPAASVFASGLTDSVRDSVERLSLHPSIALYFISFAETSKDMMRLFKDSIEEFLQVSLRILTPVIKDCAPDTPFVEDFNDLMKHDERYLFEKDATYAYGMLYALPSEYTLKSYLSEENYNLFSQASEGKTNTRECVKMLETTVKHMKMPSGMSELVYASEIAAGLEVMRSVKCARHSENSFSSVLRQLNDGKKTISSSLIDYFGKPKAVIKYLAEAFAPVCLEVTPCQNETTFRIINSTKKDFSGRLMYALYNMEGECFEEKRLNVNVQSGNSEVVDKADFPRFVAENPEIYYVLYELYDEKGIIAHGSDHFVPLKYVKFHDPKITAEISGMGKRFSVKLNSSSYAYAVKVDFEGLNVNFSDNFVTLYGKTPVVITFETSEVVTLSDLESRLKIYSPYGIGK
ncbi:MAG: hypothetical protein E7673_05590 [Ruminococcaceae bacterium]|nr:hypothetical protein [Oscillospiraceae bacterium]